MMPKARTFILFSALTLFTAASLAGCGRTEQPVQTEPQASKENAAMRSEAPLIRPVVLDKAGEVVNLEFELPPPIENASSTLLLGLRVVAPDAETGIRRSSEIIRSQLPARARLLRIEEGSITQVPLFRNTPDLKDRVAVGVDGLIPGVTSSDVERTQLIATGLTNEALFYDVMLLAGVQDAQPGHYRLTVELQGDHPQLGPEPVELLIAYMGKGK
jgi:hypothetical protein